MPKYILAEEVETILAETPGCGVPLAWVRALPVQDVKQVIHASWIEKDVFDHFMGAMVKKIVCTNCQKINRINPKPPYCPQCGAAMDAKEEKKDGNA